MNAITTLMHTSTHLVHTQNSTYRVQITDTAPFEWGDERTVAHVQVTPLSGTYADTPPQDVADALVRLDQRIEVRVGGHLWFRSSRAVRAENYPGRNR